MPPSEQQLRKRIHRLFSPDGCAAIVENRDHAEFWAPPNGNPGALHENPASPPGVTEAEWLDSPHPAFGGKSPNQVLRGCDADREKLANILCAVEEGAFS